MQIGQNQDFNASRQTLLEAADESALPREHPAISEVSVIGIPHEKWGEHPGEWVEHFLSVRYLDKYQRDADGKWRFSSRVVHYDLQRISPCEPPPHQLDADAVPSFKILQYKLFVRGART